jgi:hypothetical protein
MNKFIEIAKTLNKKEGNYDKL